MLQMIRIFNFNPFIGIIIESLISTLMMVVIILDWDKMTLEKLRSLAKPKKAIALLFLALGMAIFMFLGIIYLDISLMWLAGAWSYADWRYQLPSVIILLYCGIHFILMTIMRKGYLLEIIFLLGFLGLYAYVMHIVVTNDPVMGISLQLYAPIVGLLGILGYFVLILIRFWHNKEDGIWKNHWDCTKMVQKTFNRRIIIVLWILSVVSTILVYNGYSILSW